MTKLIAVPDNEVLAAAIALVGAPFHHAGRNPKVGIDCAGLIVAVGARLGIEIESSVNYQPFGDFNKLVSELSGQLLRAERALDTPGNVVAISTRTHPAHCGIIGVGGKLFHCVRRFGVIQDDLAKHEYGIIGAWRFGRAD